MAYDALNDQTPRAVLIGNGTRGPFTLQDADGNPIRVRDSSHLVVRRYSSTTDETGTALALSTDFTVANTDVDDVEITLTVAQAVLTSSQRLVVERIQSVSDVLSLAQGGNFSAEALAAAISVIVERLQELRRDSDRSIKVDWRETDELSLPLAPTTAATVLTRETDGSISQIEVGDISGIADLVAEIVALYAIRDDISAVADIDAETAAVAAIAAAVSDVSSHMDAVEAVATLVASLSPPGIIALNGSGGGATRTITGTANEITVTNGTGASGNPTLSLPATIVLTGKGLLNGTFSAPTFAGTIGGSATFSELTHFTVGATLGRGKAGSWDATNTDINALIGGGIGLTAFGSLYQGGESGHQTFALRENGSTDYWQWISGGGNYISDSTYDTVAMTLSPLGAAYIRLTLDLGDTADTTISRVSAGQIAVEGVQVATASNTLNLTNKTLTSPAMSGTVSGNSLTFSGTGITFTNPITVGSPVAATDAATKAYVDAFASGVQIKEAVAVATTANITLSGEQTIDGVLTSTSRVLVKNQSTASQNGIYVSAAGAWARAADMNDWAETLGALVPVTDGTVNGDTIFAATAVTGGTIGSTALNFTPFISTSGLQPLDSDLTTISSQTNTSYGLGVLELANASALRTYAGVVIGTDVQAYSAVLAGTTASFTTTDETKLDAIEDGADVTDATNVAAAGAIMDGDFGSNGIMARTGSGAYASRTITAGAGISVANGTGESDNPTVSFSHLGIQSLTDPGFDRLMFWDESLGAVTWLTLGTGLSTTGTTINVDVDASNAETLDGQTPAYYLARANHTGTQAFSTLTGLPSTLSGYGITDAQPLDTDLTTIAGQANEAYGLSLLTLTDAAALRTSAGLVIGTNVQAYDADLASWASVTRAAGFDAFAANPNSGNLAALVTSETGSGSLVFAVSPTLVSPTITSGITTTAGAGATHITIQRTGSSASTATIANSGARLAFDYNSVGYTWAISGATKLDLTATTLTLTGTFVPSGLTMPTASVGGSPTLTGTWSFSNPVTVATPTASGHAATKAYVDALVTGLSVKSDVATATTANITLSGEQTIDGVLTSASRVLVKNQTAPAENGIYVSAAGAWSRATDMDAWTETVGALVPVTGGSTQSNRIYASTTASGGTLGTTAVAFAVFVNTSGLQPLDSDLTSIAALTTTSYGRAFLELANAAAARTAIGVVIGTDVQAHSAVLDATTASFTLADESKLDGIEAAADVTDATNVAAAGAVMDGDFSTDGMMARTASGTYASRTLTAPAAGFTITNPLGIAGDPTFVLANDLAALEGLGSTGLAVRTGSDAWAQREIAVGAGLSVTNPAGTAGNPTISLGTPLATLHALTPTDNGIIIGNGTAFVVESAGTARTSLGLAIGTDVQAYDANLAALAANATTGLWIAGADVARSIVGTANEITVTNGSGASGNPAISLPSALTFTGKTVTGGTYSGPTLSGTVAGSPTASGAWTFSGGFTISTAAPRMRLVETDADSNEKDWSFVSTAGVLQLFPYNEANVPGTAALRVLRSETVVDEFEVNATAIDLNGAVDVTSLTGNVSGASVTDPSLSKVVTLANWRDEDIHIYGVGNDATDTATINAAIAEAKTRGVGVGSDRYGGAKIRCHASDFYFNEEVLIEKSETTAGAGTVSTGGPDGVDVTGVGTAFTSDQVSSTPNRVAWAISSGGEMRAITAWTSSTSVTIRDPFTTPLSGASYEIVKIEVVSGLEFIGDGGFPGRGATRWYFRPTTASLGLTLIAAQHCKFKDIEFVVSNANGVDNLTHLLKIDSHVSGIFSSFKNVFEDCGFSTSGGRNTTDRFFDIKNAAQTQFINCWLGDGTGQVIRLGGDQDDSTEGSGSAGQTIFEKCHWYCDLETKNVEGLIVRDCLYGIYGPHTAPIIYPSASGFVRANDIVITNNIGPPGLDLAQASRQGVFFTQGVGSRNVIAHGNQINTPGGFDIAGNGGHEIYGNEFEVGDNASAGDLFAVRLGANATYGRVGHNDVDEILAEGGEPYIDNRTIKWPVVIDAARASDISLSGGASGTTVLSNSISSQTFTPEGGRYKIRYRVGIDVAATAEYKAQFLIDSVVQQKLTAKATLSTDGDLACEAEITIPATGTSEPWELKVFQSTGTASSVKQNGDDWSSWVQIEKVA